MKKDCTILSLFFVLLLIIEASCKKKYFCKSCEGANQPPVAVAGPDLVITLPIDSILLDGSASNDPAGKINEWLWTKISGPGSIIIVHSTDSIAKVKSLVEGTYLFELKVTGVNGLFSKDTMQVVVKPISNRSPFANAGSDQTIALPANSVALDGTGSTDPDNNITSYLWTKISGPDSFIFLDTNTVKTQVTNLTHGIYEVELKVTDSEGLISKDTMRIYVNDSVIISHEVIYNGVWSCNDLCQDGDVYWDSSLSDAGNLLYADTSIVLSVFIRLETSPDWIEVRKYNSTLPPINEFFWNVGRGYLWVHAYHGSLIGKKVAVKVDFL